MAYSDFVEMVAREKGVSAEKLLSGKRGFALNTNSRGRSFVKRIEKLGIDLNNTRVLDIGCAYGGMSIEPGKRGAEVIGVDVDDRLLNYARVNARNEAEIKFIKCDASSIDIVREVPGRWANVIIVNDVFEHIYDTASLLKNLSILAAPGCLLYYVVPNGLSTRFVISEGHKKVFGISTVDPDCWQFFISGRARIFYRRWPYFESQFSYFGFHHFRDLTKPSSKIESVVSDINDDCEAIKRLLKEEKFSSAYAREVAEHEIEKYLHEVAYDLDNMDATSLIYKYRSDFWSGWRVMCS